MRRWKVLTPAFAKTNTFCCEPDEAPARNHPEAGYHSPNRGTPHRGAKDPGGTKR
jgi:hypothetical protein